MHKLKPRAARASLVTTKKKQGTRPRHRPARPEYNSETSKRERGSNFRWREGETGPATTGRRTPLWGIGAPNHHLPSAFPRLKLVTPPRLFQSSTLPPPPLHAQEAFRLALVSFFE